MPRGDIVKLIDKNGNAAVEYTYDTWGKLLSTSGSLAYTFGKEQPFRYRGYIYDEETGFYYLQSRYYDPEVRRFISADVYLSTGQGVLGHNAYAYCLNNPVNMSDIVGRRATTKDFSNCMTYESAGAVAIAIIITVSVQNTDITDIQEAVNKIYLWISNTITNLTNYVIDSLTYVQRKIKYEGKRIASRKKYTTKKAAKEAATLAGHKTSPIHHPDGEHGPHYHPNLPKGNPHAHDHYYYNYLIYRFIFKEWLKHE